MRNVSDKSCGENKKHFMSVYSVPWLERYRMGQIYYVVRNEYRCKRGVGSKRRKDTLKQNTGL
jgi:hypothetical protein